MTEDVERLFERARQLPPDARSAFVEEACANDSALRDELVSLLDHADAAERFFDRIGGAVRAAVPSLDRETARQFSGEDLTDASQPAVAGTEGDAMIGRNIGRYRILGLLGRGGMGAVYRAHDERLQRDVALKFLPLHLADQAGAAERFLVEARAAAALAHPNVYTVHEISETDDGRPFIAMALYEGETLKQRLRRGPLPPHEAAGIARELASALGVAHRRGIVHRDIKPGNIMLARDGVTRLLDFGLAKVGDKNLTPKGATPGTLAYMSPEQVQRHPVDHRTDLWSLGVVLFEMLAGARPFRGPSESAGLQAIVHDPPQPLPPGAPPALQRIVERLLRKVPDERYPDAAALEADLVAALLPAALSAPALSPDALTPDAGAPDTPPARLAPRPARNARRRAAGVAIVAGMGIVGVLLAVGPWRRESSPAPDAAAPAPRSLAVLPFVDMSADSTSRYFGDGLSEEITTALGRIDGLRVAARSSAFALGGRSLDARRIGDTLGVDAVLEGSVRRDGPALRVTARLVDTRSGLRVWAGEYDREAADILAVQDEIARAITDALELRLPPAGETARGSRDMNLAAYDLYLRALQLRNGMSTDAMQRATDLLDRAIELQPDFALAYAAKASVIAPRIFHGQIPQERGVREARAAIDRAFALDPELAEAHVARGIVQLFFERDWAGGERSLRRAIELNPSDAHAWHHLGNHLRAMGRPDDAVVARLRGLALDPLNARARLALGEDYLYAGQPAEALAHFERTAQLDPLHPGLLGRAAGPPLGRGPVFLAQGREGEGVQELLRVATLRGATLADTDSLRTAFATGGIRGFWRQWLAMDRRQTGPSINPLRVATLAALAGDTAEALGWLERAYGEQNPALVFVRTEPAFDGLRSHPRYVRVEQQMRFPR